VYTRAHTGGDGKVAQAEVGYLVLARNECNEVELVDECVGLAVRKLCKGKLRSPELTPSEQWL
jgi:hypothetical protein